jgi:hypothetical protein
MPEPFEQLAAPAAAGASVSRSKAADGDGGRRSQGRGDDDQRSRPAHVDAERARLVVADSKHVEEAAVQEQEERAGSDVRADQSDLAPAGGGQATE